VTVLKKMDYRVGLHFYNLPLSRAINTSKTRWQSNLLLYYQFRQLHTFWSTYSKSATFRSFRSD